MSTAGPSQVHPDVINETQEFSSPTAETQHRKRKHASGIEDVFERQDPEEKARIGRGYRDMQVEADGMLLSTVAGLRVD